MPVETLTDARVRGLEHTDGEIIDARSGLIARADRTGTITFSYRYRTGVARRRITLGRYPAMSLAEGRTAAGRLREQVRSGADPQRDRRPTLTFDALADAYLENYAKKQKSSWKNDQGQLQLYVRPSWGRRAAASITKADAARLLYDVASRAPVAANRTRATLLKMFGWACDSALLTDNPLLGIKRPHRETGGKSRVLNDDEIRVLWHALDRSQAAPGTIAALRVLLLLGQRPGEIAGMAVSELHQLDRPDAYWEIPKGRMKARKAHVVPLPPLACEIVRGELSKSDFVFVGNPAEQTRLARHSLAQVLRRLIVGLNANTETVARLKADPPTPHDLRRSCATGLAKLGIPRDDRLAVLAHSYGDVHAMHYDHFDRLPQKRAALEVWQRHVLKIIDGDAGGADIIPLRTTVAP